MGCDAVWLALVSTDVSEDLIATIMRAKRVSELGRTLVVTSDVPPKYLFLQEPHGVTF
jgi:hypothetical protein